MTDSFFATDQQIAAFTQQNLSPQSIFTMAAALPQTVGGIPGIGSVIPGLGSIPIPGLSKISSLMSPLNRYMLSTGGNFDPVNYATDLNARHPKLKFLFKVLFKGFAAKEFYYFVQRVDRPKIRLNHTEVNYYNFRTKVLTSVTYEPLSMTFLDEIGDSVNQFFTSYMKARSGNADGNYGIDLGFGKASSSFPYTKGYSDGASIAIEQIFANGSQSNRFYFINPRIESFDLDDLSMDENAGSMATIQFSYDAIKMETMHTPSRLYGWGKKDLLKGDLNAGSTDSMGGNSSELTPGSATGKAVGDLSCLAPQPDLAYDELSAGLKMSNNLPDSMSLNGAAPTFDSSLKNKTVGSSEYMQNSVITSTASDIVSGRNMAFGGSPAPTMADQVTSQTQDATITSSA